MAGTSGALPRGRSWTAIDTTKVPGHTRLYPDRLDLDPQGRPLAFAIAAGGIGYDNHVLRWNGGKWEIVYRLSYHTGFQGVVDSPAGVTGLLWQTFDDLHFPGAHYPQAYLVAGDFTNDEYTNADTIATVVNSNWIYSGATTNSTRWAIKSDEHGLRMWYSIAPRTWRDIALPGSGGNGAAAAALDDTSAIVAWVDYGAPLRWGVLSGSQWQDRGALPGTADVYSQAPTFRRSSDGTLWLAWSTDQDFVEFSTFRHGSWAMPETLRAAMLVPGEYASKSIRPSRDGWDQPVIAWVAHDTERGYVGQVCVSVPTKDGYPVAENLPGTDDAIFDEAVRDRNGDVWLVFATSGGGDGGLYSTHSYVRSTVKDISLATHGRNRSLAWTLDETAPDSRWTVLSARDDEPFQEIGVVTAGDGRDLAWVDNSPPRGHISYKVRRECLDTRYLWESPTVAWPADADRHGSQAEFHGPHSSLRTAPSLKAPAHPLGQLADLELSAPIPGSMDVALYDLQGRLVLQQRVDAGSDGRLRFSFQNASRPLTSGVYFARVRLPDGPWSVAVRTVVLK